MDKAIRKIEFLIVLVVMLASGYYFFVKNYSANASLKLSAAERVELSLRAAEGDGAAGLRLSDFYIFYKNDLRNGLRWREVAALNGKTNAAVWVSDFIKQEGNDRYRSTIERTNSDRESAILSLGGKMP